MRRSMLPLMAAMLLAAGQESPYGYPKSRITRSDSNKPKYVDKPIVDKLHEFTINGVTIKAKNRKDALRKLGLWKSKKSRK